MDRTVERMRVALLEIRATTAANQQAVPGKGHAFILEHVSHASAGMTRRGPNLQMTRAEFDLVALPQITIGALSTAAFSHCDAAAELLFENPGPCDMVRVNMGLERTAQTQVEFAQQRCIPSRLFENRVDQHGFATVAVAQKIGVGRRRRIEQLPEYQHCMPWAFQCDVNHSLTVVTAPQYRGHLPDERICGKLE